MINEVLTKTIFLFVDIRFDNVKGRHDKMACTKTKFQLDKLLLSINTEEHNIQHRKGVTLCINTLGSYNIINIYK